MTCIFVPLFGGYTRPQIPPNCDKPLWMETHPSGYPAVIESISRLPMKGIDCIYFIISDEIQRAYNLVAWEYHPLIQQRLKVNYRFIVLPTDTTRSSAETIYLALQQTGHTGSFYIRDSDSVISIDSTLDPQCNCVYYRSLSTAQTANVTSKSFLTINSFDYIDNIVENKIISDLISVGLYGFTDVSIYQHHYNHLYNLSNYVNVSDIIHSMMLNDNINIRAIPVKDYIDWGSKRDWDSYRHRYTTLFMDIDGVLITNTGAFSKKQLGRGHPIINNIHAIQDNPYQYIILTTSRPEYYRNLTIEELDSHNIRYDKLIMGLPHCKRVVVNDYANSNPYPSAIAINVERDQPSLATQLIDI